MKLLKKIQEEVKTKKYSEDEINWLITCYKTNEEVHINNLVLCLKSLMLKKYPQVLLVK